MLVTFRFQVTSWGVGEHHLWGLDSFEGRSETWKHFASRLWLLNECLMSFEKCFNLLVRQDEDYHFSKVEHINESIRSTKSKMNISYFIFYLFV